MTLLYIDGFDVQDAAARWDTWPGTFVFDTTTTADAQGSSARVNISQGAGNMAIKKFTAQSTVHLGFAFYADALTIGFTMPCFTVYGDNAATRHLWVGYDGGGAGRKWQARLDNWAGTLLASSATETYAGGTWVYVEAMIVIHDSTGRVKLNITPAGGSSATVIDFTGDTKNGGTNNTADAIGIGTAADFGSGSLKMYYDDLYILNTSGSVNNTFLGKRSVRALMPNGAGSSTQLTPSAGSDNWDLVNDIPPSDSTYNGSSTTGHRDTYALAGVDAASNVDGIQVVSRMILSGSALQEKAAIKSGSTVAYGTTRTITTTATTYVDLWETDPNTSAAWTASGVNALESGAEVV